MWERVVLGFKVSVGEGCRGLMSTWERDALGVSVQSGENSRWFEGQREKHRNIET